VRTPDSMQFNALASWLNAVEGFFAILSKRRLERGVFKGVGAVRRASCATKQECTST